MTDEKYITAMKILEDERVMELTCAMRSKDLMKKTLNPFKRIKYKQASKMFMNHSIGIQQAIYRINREIES